MTTSNDDIQSDFGSTGAASTTSDDGDVVGTGDGDDGDGGDGDGGDGDGGESDGDGDGGDSGVGSDSGA